MKKDYTALYLPEPTDKERTKGGFSTIRATEFYIADELCPRADWLIIETKALVRHLEIYENEMIDKDSKIFELTENQFNE